MEIWFCSFSITERCKGIFTRGTRIRFSLAKSGSVGAAELTGSPPLVTKFSLVTIWSPRWRCSNNRLKQVDERKKKKGCIAYIS